MEVVIKQVGEHNPCHTMISYDIKNRVVLAFDERSSPLEEYILNNVPEENYDNLHIVTTRFGALTRDGITELFRGAIPRIEDVTTERPKVYILVYISEADYDFVENIEKSLNVDIVLLKQTPKAYKGDI